MTSLFAGAGVLLLIGRRARRASSGSAGCHDAAALDGLLSPGSLLLLVLLPLLVGIRFWLLRRRRPAVRYSSLSLIMRCGPAVLVGPAPSAVRAVPARRWPAWSWRWHGRSRSCSVPAGRTTIILAMDVSRSMCATDIPPNRLIAAEAAAATFIDGQGGGTQIGIVAFAGFAEIVQPPTTDQEVLLDVVESLTTGRRTAVGSAILESLDAIAEIDPNRGPDPARRIATGRRARPRSRRAPMPRRSSSC